MFDYFIDNRLYLRTDMFKKDIQNNLAELSDERLVALASKKNQQALEILVSRYLKMIYN